MQLRRLKSRRQRGTAEHNRGTWELHLRGGLIQLR